MATFNISDLEYILTQIQMAETNQPPANPHWRLAYERWQGRRTTVWLAGVVRLG